ncbi:hypothetical protein TIFTF001_045703 [Ficus carica]|uniref:Uncharacterized protein n=1 Tax=Ficus carica TaxID=3494 RepID=A0AA87YTM8_FICCA|nr:hypothetical protein TIFTF001_045703 [Ficus carica]
MVQLPKIVPFGTLWPATMRERHLMLLAWMSHPPSLLKLCQITNHDRPPYGCATGGSGEVGIGEHSSWGGQYKSEFEEGEGEGVLDPQRIEEDLFNHIVWAPRTWPPEGETPHGLALVSQPSRLPSLAPLASQGLYTSTSLRPATTRRSHLMLLALVIKLR